MCWGSPGPSMRGQGGAHLPEGRLEVAGTAQPGWGRMTGGLWFPG